MTCLVLLHGQPGAGSDWDAVVAGLPDGFDCLAPDRPGYRSERAAPTGMRGNAEWVLDLLDARGIRDVVLVAHSWGGGVAIEVAAMAPERVRGLVLVASVGPDCLTAADHIFAAPVIGPVGSWLVFQAMPWIGRLRLAGIKRRLGRPLRTEEHIDLDTWANARHRFGAMWRTFMVEQRDMVSHTADLDAALRLVRAPSLIVADPQDNVVPFATAQALRRILPNSTLMPVDHGGHSLPRKVPDTIAQAITRFVTSLGEAGG